VKLSESRSDAVPPSQTAPAPARPAHGKDVEAFRKALKRHGDSPDPIPVNNITPTVISFDPSGLQQPGSGEEIVLVTKLKTLVAGMPPGTVPPAVVEVLHQPSPTRTDLMRAIFMVES
jgi:hypothetical protein